MANIKYNPNVHDNLVWLLRSCGVSDTLIAERLEINLTTLYRWRTKYESFRLNYEEGYLLANAKVQRSLFNRAVGYNIEEVDTKIAKDQKGKIKSITTNQKTKHIPGDTTAQIFWLKNRMPEQWKDKIEETGTNGDGLVQSLIAQMSNIDLEKLEQKEQLEKELKELKEEIEKNNKDKNKSGA